MIEELYFYSLFQAVLVFLGYAICYLNWSLTLPVITICTLVWFETQTSDKGKKISTKSRASSMNKKDILKLIDELPSWVTFPDRERAEWLNEVSKFSRHIHIQSVRLM